MDRHKRMAQTLGCLVASMTVGAVVLHWGLPASGRVASAPPVELSAVAVTQPWQGIHIGPSGPGGQFDPARIHFFVDRKGFWSLTESWNAQRSVGGRGIIRIALEPSPDGNQISGPQWETTQRLRKVLVEKCRIPIGRVDLDDTLVPPLVEPQRSSVAPPRNASNAQPLVSRSR